MCYIMFNETSKMEGKVCNSHAECSDNYLREFQDGMNVALVSLNKIKIEGCGYE